MKSTSLVTMAGMLLSAFCLIAWTGFSKAWAKGPVGNQGTTSNIAQRSKTHGKPSALRGYPAQAGQASQGTNQQGPTESISFNYGKIEYDYSPQK